MNAATLDAAPSLLVEVIELKWLLAGEGMHLHVERMLGDAAYARDVLGRAAQARSPVLRAAVDRLRLRLPPEGEPTR